MTYGAVAADEALSRNTEPDNFRVWNGARGHYEVWYLTLNHVASQTGFWIRYTMEAPLDPGHAPYAQLWFASFDAKDPTRNVALNRKFPIEALRAATAPFALEIGEAVLGHGRAKGALSGNGHSVSWDLTWLPAERTHRHLPDLIYKTSFADTRVLSPNLDVPIRGLIVVDGQPLVLEGDPGGQTHLWGRKHAHAWAWGHSNAFEGRRGAAFEALTVRLKRKGVVLPPLTLLTLYLDGEELRFTDFRNTLLNRGHFATARYAFSATGPTAKLNGEFTCRPDDMTTAAYSDPDGEPSFCANTEVADLLLHVSRRSWLGRWREDARLVANKTAHFEVAGRTPDPRITRRHVTV